MATDAASLLIKVDASQASKAAGDLDKLTAAGRRAEGSAIKVSAAQVKAAGGWHAWEAATVKAARATDTASVAATKMVRTVTGAGTASGLARHHVQNLAFQVNDLAVSLASGQAPMRVFMQQGSQIAQIGQQAGVGVGGLAMAVLRMIAPFSGLIAVAGLLGTALLGVKQAASDDAAMKQFIGSLGLTKKEMEELTDTTITWGDVGRATFEVLAEGAGTSAEQITGFFGDAFQAIGEFGKFSVGILLGSFAGLVKGIASAFVNLGKLVANAISGAANFAIESFETMINKIIGGLNTVAGFIGKVFGKDVGTIGAVQFGRVGGGFNLSNPFTDAKDQFLDTFGDVQAGFDRIAARADQRRRDRIQSQADELIGDRSGTNGSAGGGGTGDSASAHRAKAKALEDEARAYEQALKAAQNYLASITQETARIGKTAIEIKRIEVNAAAAAAPTAELAQAIRDAGAAWEEVTKAQSVADFIKNVIEPLEFENSLIGASIEAQRQLRAERELTAAGIERGSTAWDRYIAATQAAVANDNTLASQQNLTHYIDGLASAITDVIMGTASLKEAFSNLARSIIADIIQMTIRMLIFRAIAGIFGGASSNSMGGGLAGAAVGSAKGNVFAAGNIVPFARGGVVDMPMMFPMGGGKTGMMGEAGPEAVMPLARDSQGRLGVRSANNNEPVEIHLVVDTSENLMVKTAVVADAVYRRNEPGTIKRAANVTLRAANRPVLMGRR